MSIKGEVGILYIWDGALYRPLACLTSNSLNTTVSVIESQNKCNPGVVVRKKGLFSYSLDFEGEYIDTTSVGGDDTKASHDFLLEAQMTEEFVDWKLVTGVTGADYYGSSIITDLSLSQPSGDELSTFSGTFSGLGTIEKTDPHA